MIMPPTHWNFSLETQTDRITDTICNTVNRFFSTHGFCVLPYLVAGNSRAVYLPKLNYNESLFERIAKLPVKIPMPIAERDAKIINKEVAGLDWQLDSGRIKEIRRLWNRVELQFWDQLSRNLVLNLPYW